MRYGENIDEVSAKPAWTCPVCRDLCNCSIHRVRRGWMPTGTLYRKAIALGKALQIGHTCQFAQTLAHQNHIGSGRHCVICSILHLFALAPNCDCPSCEYCLVAGYKSVAHFLVNTHLATKEPAEASDTETAEPSATAAAGTLHSPRSLVTLCRRPLSQALSWFVPPGPWLLVHWLGAMLS